MSDPRSQAAKPAPADNRFLLIEESLPGFTRDNEVLNICLDPVFKAVMTKNTLEAETARKGLLSALVGKTVVVTTVINNEPAIDSLEEKKFRFDVAVTFDDGEHANIEMCSRAVEYHRERMELYAAKLHASQPLAGKGYHLVKPTYQASIIAEGEIFPDRVLEHRFTAYDLENHMPYGGLITLLTLELAKLDKAIFEVEDVGKLKEIEKWALFLAYYGDSSKKNLIDQIVAAEETFKMTEQAILNVSRDREECIRLHSEYKAMMDLRCLLPDERHAGYLEGIADGKAEGLAEGKLEIASNMQKLGLPLETIRVATGLTQAEIENLQ